MRLFKPVLCVHGQTAGRPHRPRIPRPAVPPARRAAQPRDRHGGPAAGDPFENEIALADRLGLSRPTVRRAIHELVAQGLLLRRRGLGTTVANRQVHRRAELTSLLRRPQARGAGRRRARPCCRTRSSGTSGPPRRSSCRRTPPLLAIVRLRHAGDLPLARDAQLAAAGLQPTSPARSWRSDGLYAVLRERGGPARGRPPERSAPERRPRAERRHLALRAVGASAHHDPQRLRRPGDAGRVRRPLLPGPGLLASRSWSTSAERRSSRRDRRPCLDRGRGPGFPHARGAATCERGAAPLECCAPRTSAGDDVERHGGLHLGVQAHERLGGADRLIGLRSSILRRSSSGPPAALPRRRCRRWSRHRTDGRTAPAWAVDLDGLGLEVAP